MKKLCIFDLDGTLASTLESMAVAANRVLREMNLPEQPTESFKYFASHIVLDNVNGVLTGIIPKKNQIFHLKS